MFETRGNNHRAEGFTLIELLVAVTIIGIVATIAVPALNTAMEKSRQRATVANMRAVGNALQIYQNDLTSFPPGTLDINQLAVALLGVTKRPIPVHDSWGRDFDYRSDGLVEYSVESFGRDGVPGADISPAQANNFDLDIVLSDGIFVASVN
ncbi:MAG: type II secretion system protein [Acidobacteriota bacterium]